MKQQVKQFIKKNIPARYLEIFSSRAIAITKIPKNNAVISDLFVLRCEAGWETYFECLDFDRLLNANHDNSTQKLTFCFYSKEGQFIAEKEIILTSAIKTTLLVNKIASDFNIKEDCLFAIFHPQKKQWITKHKSFIAERGYIGYANPTKGIIKGFVHGNLDAIARDGKNEKDYLLGNYSFLTKEYRLQHLLDAANSYELFLVNPTVKEQRFTVLESSKGSSKKTTLIIPSRGFFKYIKAVDKKGDKTTVIIESKLYLARPIVFKYMPSSFDVFHG